MGLGDNSIALLWHLKVEGSPESQREVAALRSAVTSDINQLTTTSKAGMAQIETANASMGESFLSSARNVALVGTVAVGAVAGLFAFAKQATETAANLYDLHQQTGFNVETLSALKNIADTTGGSIEGVSGALNIFQANQVKAREGNKELNATFQALNISTRDNERGLRDAFSAIAALTNKEEQLARARQLFGKSGAQVLAIIRDTNGNLDEAIKKFSDLGQIISTEDAKAADEFHDQLAAVGRETESLGRSVAIGLLPILQSLLGMVGWLTTAFKGWGMAIDWVKEKMGGSWVEKAFAAVKAFHPGLGAASAVQGVMDAMQSRESGPPSPSGAGSGRGGKPATGISEEGQAELNRLKELNRGLTDAARQTRENLDREFEQGRVNRENFYNQSKADVDKEYRLRMSILMQQETAANTYIKKEQELNDKLAEVERERQEAKRTRAKEFQRLDDEQKKAELDARVAQLKREDEVERFYEEKQLESAEALIKSGAVTENDVDELRFKQKQEQLERRLVILRTEIEAYGEFSEKYQSIMHDIQMADNERTENEEANERRRAEVRARELAAEMDKATGRTGDGTVPEDEIGKIIEAQIGPPPDMQPHMDAIAVFRDFAVGAWGVVTQGFGHMVEAFLTGGNLAGQSFGKMTKAAIASVAAQASVRALFEIGMWLATLWLNPAESATHLLAAQTFGLVALMASGAALAIPGGGGAGGGTTTQTSSSSGRGSSQQNQPVPIEANRRQSEQAINVNVNVRRDPGSIVDVVVEDFRNNGRTKQVIGNDGMLAAV